MTATMTRDWHDQAGAELGLTRPLVPEAVGQEVEVYRNLSPQYRNRDGAVYSVRSVATGKVLGHCEDLTLWGAAFRVSEAGRQRVLRTGRKAVHATIRGTLTGFRHGGYSCSAPLSLDMAQTMLEAVDELEPHLVRYNPHSGPFFTVEVHAGWQDPISGADIVECRPQGVQGWI